MRTAATPPAAGRTRERFVARVLLGAAVLFCAWFARFDWTVAAPSRADRVLHVTLANEAAAALARGADPTDHWVPEIGFGHPVPHHYQHLPHVFTAIVYRALGGAVGMQRCVGFITWALLCAWPLALYAGGRKLGLDRLAAAGAALLGPLVATHGRFGLEFGSVAGAGSELYGQAFACVLLPLTVGEGVRALRTGRHCVRAAALLAVCGLSHLLSGYIAGVSLVVAALVPGPAFGPRWRRLGAIAGLAALASAYHLLPLVADWAHQNVSIWERRTNPGKLDSYGHLEILGALCTGGLFDYARFPTVTLACGLGTVVATVCHRQRAARTVLVLGGVWLALYFGRPTWGGLMDLLPFAGHLHLHRFVVGVHLMGAWIAGLGAGVVLRWWLASPMPWARIGLGVGLALCVLPAHRERAVQLAWYARFQEETLAAWRRDGPDIEGALAAIRSLPPGRVYAGLPTNWGATYRIGHVEVFALAPPAGLASLGYLYNDFSFNADLMPHFNDRQAAHYGAFNVRYVLVPAGTQVPPFLRLHGQFGRQALYTVDTPGYFGLVDADLEVAGPPGDWYEAAVGWIRTGAIDAGVHPRIAVGAAPGGAVVPLARLGGAVRPLLAPRPPRGRVVGEQVAPGRYRADVEAARACWLMCRVTFHPGWHATVDGVPVVPEMLAPAFIGVPIGPGSHHVDLEYRPRWWRKWLLLLGWGGLLGLGVWLRRRDRFRLTAPVQPLPSAPTAHP